jgi:hypothetical protein
MQNSVDVVIIGAGPYSLSAAAHLRVVAGLQTRVFGEPMSFWKQNMPAGMFLRSPWSATHIADPNVKLGTPIGNQLRISLDNGTEQMVDHLLFGTGYRTDIAKYPFMGKEFLPRIDRVRGCPRLKKGLESSVAGLHFLRARAAWSFGPVARFVSGTYCCVHALARKIAHSS